MNYNYAFRHVDLSKSLMEYSETSFDKLSRNLPPGGTWFVTFTKGRFDCKVDVFITSPWGSFKAQGKGESFYSAVDNVTTKIETQLKKQKDKHKNHKKTERTRYAKLERLNEALEYREEGPASLRKVS